MTSRNNYVVSRTQSDIIDPLTDIEIASELINVFRRVSDSNTKIETGGILGGRKVGDNYRLTHLIIPSQKAKSDSFEITNATEIHDYFEDNSDLLNLGIIHTHPGFESFLSSIDMQMLYGYTCLNPSAISIVLAPERNTYPAYSLTALGMNTLNTCPLRGLPMP